MILKDTLRKIALSQKQELEAWDKGIPREKLKDIELGVPYAIVISGVRRCGKSTLLKQLTNEANDFYFFNFEDPRLAGFEIKDFPKLNEVFEEEHGVCDYYFFDEIQNVSGWEKFVRSMLDKKKKFVITGSNASLLSKELGTHLTGRHLNYELFPFSFKEFIDFSQKKPSVDSFEDYFQNGGFPDYLKYSKSEILHELLRDIVIRDIAVRHNLREVKTLREMAVFLLTNIGKEFSYNNLKNIFGLGSTNTVVSFVSYLEDSYLIFTVPKFDTSLKKQLVNPKKIYSVDNGVSRINSASLSEDKGRMLENTVFLELRRKHRDIFYFKEKGECDFVVREGRKVTEAVQVCYDLNEDNNDREVNGLVEAMKRFGLKKGLILTYNQSDVLETGSKKVIVKPVWKWLLAD